jgi:hypothetical protein
MKFVTNEEMKKELFENSKKYIGGLLYTKDGWVCQIVEIDKENEKIGVKPLFKCSFEDYLKLKGRVAL